MNIIYEIQFWALFILSNIWFSVENKKAGRFYLALATIAFVLGLIT